MRLEQSKNHSIQKYLETSSKYGILMQLEARSEERIAILSNTVHVQSFSTTHCLQFASRKRYA